MENEKELERIKEVRDEAIELTEALTDFVNVYGGEEKHEEFIRQFNMQHRTLQQSTLRMLFKVIEYVASDDYNYDLRNKQSHIVCKNMINGYFKEIDADVDDESKEFFKPSRSLPTI